MFLGEARCTLVKFATSTSNSFRESSSTTLLVIRIKFFAEVKLLGSSYESSIASERMRTAIWHIAGTRTSFFSRMNKASTPTLIASSVDCCFVALQGLLSTESSSVSHSLFGNRRATATLPPVTKSTRRSCTAWTLTCYAKAVQRTRVSGSLSAVTNGMRGNEFPSRTTNLMNQNSLSGSSPCAARLGSGVCSVPCSLQSGGGYDCLVTL